MCDGIENNIIFSHLISKKRDWRFNIRHNCRAGAFCNWTPLGAAQGHGVGQSQPLPASAKGRIKEHSIILPNIFITLIHPFARFTYVIFFFLTFSNSELQCYCFILMIFMDLSPLWTFTMQCITVSKVNCIFLKNLLQPQVFSSAPIQNKALSVFP